MKHLIDLDDFSLNEINSIIDKAIEIKKNPHEFSDVMHGKIIGTLFYEPSTRTQMSFQTAMLRLGGQVIGFNNPQNSSIAKGENFKDTIKVIGKYADIIDYYFYKYYLSADMIKTHLQVIYYAKDELTPFDIKYKNMSDEERAQWIKDGWLRG